MEVVLGTRHVAIEPPTPLFVASKIERRALDFFCGRTSVRLSGFYNCTFWNTVVLQIAVQNEGVRHALVALAALDESNSSCRGLILNKAADTFALKQYNRAIEQHVKQLTSFNGQPTVEALAPSLIFICIEMIRGHLTTGLTLLKKAVCILHELLSTSSCTQSAASDYLLQVLETELKRLEVQAIGLVGSAAWGSTNAPQTIADHALVPERFASVQEARACLDFYSNSNILTASDRRYPGQSRESRQSTSNYYFDIFTRWSSAFDALLLASGHQMTDNDQCVVLAIQMQKLILTATLDRSTRSEDPDDQMLWDRYGSIFSQIIDLAESLLVISSGAGKSTSESASPLFTLDMAIIGPLYDIARACRNPQIRRRAIELLRTYPRQEGLWDGPFAARVAERIMQIEESSADTITSSADVPRWARISDVHPIFEPEQEKTIICYERFQTADSLIKTSMQEVMI